MDSVNGFALSPRLSANSREKRTIATSSTTFRKFRDDWLAKAPGGERKIQEYYLYAPMLVQKIDRRADRGAVYQRIWQEYLQSCLKDLEAGKPEACARTYEGNGAAVGAGVPSA